MAQMSLDDSYLSLKSRISALETCLQVVECALEDVDNFTTYLVAMLYTESLVPESCIEDLRAKRGAIHWRVDCARKSAYELRKGA